MKFIREQRASVSLAAAVVAILLVAAPARAESFPLPTVVELAPVPDNGRWMHAAQWDGAHGLFVFGGNTYDKPLSFNKSNALLHYDLPSNTWRMEHTEGPWPDARSRGGFASLSNGTFVVAAGNGGTGLRRCLSDTWRLRQDPVTQIWTAEEVQTNSLPHVGDVVVVGMLNKSVAGFFPGACQEQELRYTLELPPDSSNWKPYAWGADGPRGRSRHVAVADASGETVYFWGGFPNLEAILPSEIVLWSRVWAYNAISHQWSLLTDGSTGPSDRFYPAVAFDNVSNQVLMFGGSFLFTSQSHLYGDLWAFNPATRTWSQLLEDNPALARVQASGVYCPCEGGMLVTGGRNTSVSERGTAETSNLFVRIEHPVDAVWINPASRGNQRQLQLIWRDAKEPLGAIRTGLTLRSCRTGELLGTATGLQSTGRHSWMAHFRDLDWTRIDELAAQGDVTVTGRIEGDDIALLGRVGAANPLHSADTVQLHREASVPSAVQRVSPGIWHLHYGHDAGAEMRIEAYDVLGRRVQPGPSTDVGKTGSVIIDGRTWPKGIYFIRLLSPNRVLLSTRLVNLGF